MERIQGSEPRCLIMESCKHHRQADDIGTVKIPRLFTQMVNAEVDFDFTRDMTDTPALYSHTISSYTAVAVC
jgi:hypothetical protein